MTLRRPRDAEVSILQLSVAVCSWSGLVCTVSPRLSTGSVWGDLRRALVLWSGVYRVCPAVDRFCLGRLEACSGALVWCVPCLPGCRQVLFGETLGVLWWSGLVCTVSARLSTGSVRGDSGRALVWCVPCLSGRRQVLFGETLGVLWWSGLVLVVFGLALIHAGSVQLAQKRRKHR